MPAAKYSEEFKEQVVREVIEKERTISSVASSYDLVPQTVGQLGRQIQKRSCHRPGPQEGLRVSRDSEAESGEQGAASGERFPEKSSRLLRQGTTVTERYELINREEGSYPHLLDVPVVQCL